MHDSNCTRTCKDDAYDVSGNNDLAATARRTSCITLHIMAMGGAVGVMLHPGVRTPRATVLYLRDY